MAAITVTNFDEIAIRAPRPGFFVGDCVHKGGESPEEIINPIVRHYALSQVGDIPPPPRLFPLGRLTLLPVEILSDIILHLDVLSVLNFRNVNQRATAVVSSLQEFNFIVSFPKAMSAVINMKCRFFSLRQLAASLYDTRCSRCEKHFGELLYLITAERICWPCWRRYRDFIPKTSRKEMQFEVTIDILKRIPHIAAVLGKYGEMGPGPYATINTPGHMLDRRAAVAELDRMNAMQVEYQIPADPDPEPERVRMRAPESAAAANYLGNWFTKPMNNRYIAFLRAPYFDRELQEFVGGYFCRACIGRKRFSDETRSARRLKFPESIWHEPWCRYTRDGFWEHVQKYGPILKREIDGLFVHDSPQRETQTPDDVQWEMYRHEDEILAEELDIPDDHPIPSLYDGRPVPHNCQ